MNLILCKLEFQFQSSYKSPNRCAVLLTRSRNYTLIYLAKGHMVLPSSLVEFNKVCTPFDGKPALHLFSQKDA